MANDTRIAVRSIAVSTNLVKQEEILYKTNLSEGK